MSFSQRLAVITLIHKKGDKKLLKNYRPISLTNTDYKIIAFVFARRLQTIIDKLISNSQTAYVKGRFIGLNARLIKVCLTQSADLSVFVLFFLFKVCQTQSADLSVFVLFFLFFLLFFFIFLYSHLRVAISPLFLDQFR